MSEISIFLSYRQSACKLEANTLYHRMKGDYKSVFWDEKEIQLTEDWKKKFLHRLRKSTLFIPLISASTLSTFRDTGVADNVLLEWDIAIDRYEKNELKILPLFILESGQKDFDFSGVPSHSTPALGCKRSFKEIWEVFKRIKGFFIHFDEDKDLRLFELEIEKLVKGFSPAASKLINHTVVSKSINRPRYFVGREEDLAVIGAFLLDVNKSRSVVIHSGPGMGKTTIASKFALQANSQYTQILWISLVSDATFIDSVSKSCKQLGLPQDNDTDNQKLMIFDWLEIHDGYLLILDNADDLVLVRKCLDGISRFAGHVIITTRNSIIDQHIPLGMENIDIHHQELKFWDKPTSKAYVASRLEKRMQSITDDETAALDKILDYSEGYPLAIEQICSYLSVERTVNFTALLGTLDAGNMDEVWKRTLLSGASHYQRTLDAVVDIALSSLQNNGHEEACVLLAGIAYVSNKDIPIGTYLARFLSNAGFTKNVHEALTPIIEMSLVTLDSKDTFVSIHLATQEVLRRNLSSLKIGSGNKTKTTFVDSSPTKPDSRFETFLKKSRKPKPANSHVDRSLKAVVEPSPATIVDWVDLSVSSIKELIPLGVNGSYQRSAFEVGITLFSHILELSKTPVKKTTKFGRLCYIAARLADFFCSYAHARNLFTIAIESYSESYGSRINEDVADSIMSLGLIADDQGKYDEAKTLCTECLEIYEKVYGTREHASVANTINNLGSIAMNQGKQEEAKTLYTESLEIYEKVYGTREHASVANIINNLGLIAKNQGNYDEAKTLYTECLEIDEKMYGTREHASTASTIMNLGLVAKNQGEYEEAEGLISEGLEICEKVFKSRIHVVIARNLCYLGEIQFYMGDIENGIKCVQESLAIYEVVVGQDHPEYARAAEVLDKLSNF